MDCTNPGTMKLHRLEENLGAVNVQLDNAVAKIPARHEVPVSYAETSQSLT
jgi:hypothetical protein